MIDTKKYEGHTPGLYLDNDGESVRVRGEDDGTVCQLHWLKGRHGLKGRRDEKEVLANARLFADGEIFLAEVERLKEELTNGDYWQKRATDYLENGNCPICFETDEAGHKPDCTWGQSEKEIERLTKENADLSEQLETRDAYHALRAKDAYHALRAKLERYEAALDEIHEALKLANVESPFTCQQSVIKIDAIIARRARGGTPKGKCSVCHEPLWTDDGYNYCPKCEDKARQAREGEEQ